MTETMAEIGTGDTEVSHDQAIGQDRDPPLTIGVIIPCYRVGDRVLDVLAAIPAHVQRIYCIDDCCPEHSGKTIQSQCKDPRVQVLFNANNQGVGGATIEGYRALLKDNLDIAIKIDGDGQMDPSLIPQFTALLEVQDADYCKGNRFYWPGTLAAMPTVRIIGNAMLSFMTKFSSGYWNVVDPTNGYTAIHATALKLLSLDDIDRRYFFESDMLFRLNMIGAVVRDIPMTAVYDGETSNLSIRRIIGPFVVKNMRNFLKRILYSYYLRDFNLASLEWPTGIGLLGFGFTFGLWHWIGGYIGDQVATAGTVMVAGLSIMVGLQMLLSAFNFDIQNVPKTPIQRLFPRGVPLPVKKP